MLISLREVSTGISNNTKKMEVIGSAKITLSIKDSHMEQRNAKSSQNVFYVMSHGRDIRLPSNALTVKWRCLFANLVAWLKRPYQTSRRNSYVPYANDSLINI